MEEKIREHSHPVSGEIFEGYLLGEDDLVKKGDFFPDRKTGDWVQTQNDGLSPKEMGDEDPWVRPPAIEV